MTSPKPTNTAQQDAEAIRVVIEVSGSDKVHTPGPRADRGDSVSLQSHSDPTLAADFARLRHITESNSMELSFSTRDISLKRRMADHFDGGFDTHTVQTAVLALTSAPVALAAIQLLRHALVEWIKARSTRQVKITAGDRSVEITGTNDIDKVLETLQQVGEVFAKKQSAEPHNRRTAAKKAKRASKAKSRRRKK